MSNVAEETAFDSGQPESCTYSVVTWLMTGPSIKTVSNSDHPSRETDRRHESRAGRGHLERGVAQTTEAQVSLFTTSHEPEPSRHDHDVLVVNTNMR